MSPNPATTSAAHSAVWLGDIDLLSESWLSISQARRHRLLLRPDGKPRHISRLYAYVGPGGCGGVRLEAFRSGGVTFTTEQAILRFIRRCSGAPASGESPKQISIQRRGEIARAKASLVAAGIE